jgi:diaminohydroxyphosphoribosylaminopyrimidine deaminase/5-amino-6-(5-phosphoribosylamino)uracil reductase
MEPPPAVPGHWMRGGQNSFHPRSAIHPPMPAVEFELAMMRRALELAERGRGFVEPNPLVGCVLARGAEPVAEGWHARFGGPHAEIEALRSAGEKARGATLYVTLEPCCHRGKTPPCTRAILEAGVSRVVAAVADPFPQVAGGGLKELAAAGVAVESGLLEDEARHMNAPYFKLLATGRPWVIAKWAMTLDGRLATRTGESRWISNETSRARAHVLRGRVDAILVGSGTARADDPLLTARPPGPRVATRVVFATRAALASDSRLVRTAADVPVLVAASGQATAENCRRLTGAGCEVFVCAGDGPRERLACLLEELGRRKMTNVLVEGGARLLGTCFHAGAVDEAHVFIAPLLFGGASAPGPVGGEGVDLVAQAWRLVEPIIDNLDGDIYVRGRVKQATAGEL